MDDTDSALTEPVVETHFETPSWLDPRPLQDQVPTQRTPPEYDAQPAHEPGTSLEQDGQATADGSAVVSPQIPGQAEPAHDQYTSAAAEQAAAPAPILDSGHWVERRKPRMLAGTLLLAALVGVAVCLTLTITTQSAGAIAGLVASTVVAVIFRGALMSSGVTVVDLKGATLRVQREGRLHVFNLADPAHLVTVIGTPNQAGWRLQLQALNDELVELDAAHVNPVELHPTVIHYRERAELERRRREERFNR